MGNNPLWRDSFHTVNYFIFNYEASTSRQQQIRRCCPSRQRGDEVCIVSPPTFFNRRNAPTARGASCRIHISGSRSREYIDMLAGAPEVGLRL